METKKNIFEYFWFVVSKNYANFNGRARRMEYWSFVLVNFLIGIVVGVINVFTIDLLAIGGTFGSFFNLGTLLNLVLIVPSMAVGVRRFHDTNKSGAVPILLSIITFVYSLSAAYFLSQMSSIMDRSDMGLFMGVSITFVIAILILGIYALIVFFTHGTHGPNQYGPDPKYPDLGNELEQIGVE